jgi:predicted acyltransferase
LTSLDVFRGLTIIGMLLVNNPGDWEAAYRQLRHSPWHGWTIADLVFPYFLFIVGITTHLSLRARAARGDSDSALRKQIFRRGAALFLIGLLLNWFPFYHFGPVPTRTGWRFLDHLVARLLELRFLGVLQRIGIAYIAAALISWRAPTRRVVGVTVALVVGYWLALTVLPVPGEGAAGAALIDDPARTLAAWVDRVTLDWSRWGLGIHLWEGSRVFDPEGLLSTLPAIATTLIGVLAGRGLAGSDPLGERVNRLFVAGALLTVAGLAWSAILPINKNLWSSSYVLFTAGLACTTLATIAWVVDVKRWTGWTQPFVVFGTNAITAYVGAELTAMLFDTTIRIRVAGHSRSLHQLAHDALLGTRLPPALASLGYAVAFVVLWYFLVRVLYRRGIMVKI